MSKDKLMRLLVNAKHGILMNCNMEQVVLFYNNLDELVDDVLRLNNTGFNAVANQEQYTLTVSQK